ncbi:MAG: hypothetical protein J7K13_06065 [Thermoplasmata archaeon]|nr:hypothetical protein [Thermoplasmata archaeon]
MMPSPVGRGESSFISTGIHGQAVVWRGNTIILARDIIPTMNITFALPILTKIVNNFTVYNIFRLRV